MRADGVEQKFVACTCCGKWRQVLLALPIAPCLVSLVRWQL